MCAHNSIEKKERNTIIQIKKGSKKLKKKREILKSKQLRDKKISLKLKELRVPNRKRLEK